MTGCTEVADDFQALEQYKEDFMAQKDFYEKFEANVEKYAEQINKSFSLEILEWQQGVYFNSGMFAGYIQQYYGLAPPLSPPEPSIEESATDRDAFAPAQFVAGWYYGVVGEDKRDYIVRDCYQQNDDLTNTLYDGMEAYIAGNQDLGDDKLKATKALYKTALSTCTDVTGKMQDVMEKAEALVSRDDWAQLAKQIYDDNKTLIDRDVDLELREWQQGVFFNSGMFAGYIEKVFLDARPEPEQETPATFYSPF